MSAPWRTGGSVDRHIDASPEELYQRISDVTSTGRRSTECRSCTWLRGHTPATLGARFRGRNRVGLIRWSRICEVTAAEPGREFRFRTVPSRWDPMRVDSTTWRYVLVAEEGGTRVTHSYEFTKMPVWPFNKLYARLFPHHGDMRPHMAHTLDSLRAELQHNAVHTAAPMDPEADLTPT